MTKEYAIQILREMTPKFARCNTDVKILTAIRMAIQALQEKPKYPCELCKWHLQEDDTTCWGCNAKPIEEGAEE